MWRTGKVGVLFAVRRAPISLGSLACFRAPSSSHARSIGRFGGKS